MNDIYNPFQPTLTKSGLQRFELTLVQAPACKVLRGIVHSYLQISAATSTPYPVMPDGTQAVFISLQGLKIGGAQTQTRDILIPQRGDYFGIRFYPGALRHFFDLNLGEITNQFVDAQYFPCRDFAQLHSRIYEYQNFYDRAQVCEQWLLQHFKTRPVQQLDRALSLIYQSFGNIKISQLATRVGWSSRHLNRLFRLHTGLSTKNFAQIVRIQNACKQMHTTTGQSLNTALTLGYYDQSHLIKEYKKHLLSNPSSFISRFMSDFYNR
ncbi:MAG: hypothetical protein AMJ53_17675 [Gammaproteobacteria bacterium SG8_11]|nr:MAG: hypothetical protein AMJ53_17675 [Gammaproteobacteria bacterium SG8_11]